MSTFIVALIINRNRILIANNTKDKVLHNWVFPAGTAEREENQFEAIKRIIKKRHSIDIFPYRIIGSLIHHDKTANTRLALIKCSISDETKLYLSTKIPSEYKWLDIFNTKDIAFAPVDQNIITYLTQGKSIIRSNRKSSGFASMSEENRKLIASMGGRHAHALGKAHEFSHEEAVRAGVLGWQKPNQTKKRSIATTNLKKSQLQSKKQYKKAIASFMRAIYLLDSKRTDNYAPYANLAGTLLLDSRPSEVVKLINSRAIKKFPDNSELYLSLAVAEYKIGNRQNAIEASTRAYQLSQDDYNKSIFYAIKNNLPINLTP